MKSLTSTQKVREAIAVLRGREFTFLDLKHIYNYGSRMANMLAMGEVEEIGEVEGRRVFKATEKLKSWDYQQASHTDRKYQSRAFNKALKEQATPLAVRNVTCEGWRDVLPFLFNDPYYKIQGRTVTVSQI